MKYVPPFGPPGTIQPDASYINGDPNISRKGSIPPAEALEHPQREIVNLISDAQQSPSDDDLHQTTRAVRDGKLNFCIDSGPLNQIQVELPGPLMQSYTAGLVLNVLIAHTNTGPTRIAIGALNPTTVKRPDGSELAAGDLLAGMVALLICDGTYFQCINIGTGETGAPNTSIFKIDIPYVHDTGTNPNALIGLYSPPLDDIREGRTVEIKLKAAVTGPTVFTPNNFPTHPVAHPDGSPIQAGDGVDNQIWLLCFDGIQWQLLGVYFSAITPPAPDPVPVAGSKKSLQFTYGYWPSDWAWTYYPSPTSNAMSWLERRFSINGNRAVWTYSCFIKRDSGVLITDSTGTWSTGINCEAWFTAGPGYGVGAAFTGVMYVGTSTGNEIRIFWGHNNMPVAGSGGAPNGGALAGYFLRGLMMDTKWHHFLMTADGSQISAYVDGVLAAQGTCAGYTGDVDSAYRHVIGGNADDGGMCYGTRTRMAEIILVDGQSLDWTKFATNIGGIIVPKAYTGTFGTDGFYLNWQDSSACTSTTLGKDWSGNGNNFTPVNFTLAQVLTDYPGAAN
jgi:hypothetical protein